MTMLNGRGHVAGRSGVRSTRCCARTVASCRSHVTCSVFAKGMLCGRGARVGAERGTSRRVVGAWGVVPGVGGCIMRPGGLVF
jgi:hypothetical protein